MIGSTRIALLVAAVSLAVVVGYRTLIREPSQSVVPPNAIPADPTAVVPDEMQIVDDAAGVSPVDPSPPTTNYNDLHQDLVAMSAPVRNHILWRILGDAGYRCAEVRNSHLLGTDAWRADCGSAVAYSIVIDEYNDISINPIPYGDFIP